MITREFQKGDAASVAVYSDCEHYRYALTRVWEPQAKRVLFIMLNPSKATEIQNDPTVERCERRARALGFGGFRVVNIFGLRETHPQVMRQAADPVGPENDLELLAGCDWADQIICGWGTHGAHRDRGSEVADLLRARGHRLYHLGLSKAGHPKHPLYIAYATQPMRWDRENATDGGQ
ncbi:DUF1643 domain-containing protein [Aliiroseovarius crassostreae]|uniref:DUF1643 domain-containing protein n=1 Tax=Aliiroseovarius crassostreae TaxID=154981 RepID=A0A9Q9HD03_9RHOB|nr:DUF1643 domain-containing protein [Aliiroseovarius crassostreae]UWP93840.1 DUF1643 domain-containing protein [Aliiroseovarius crassostreae]UWP96981.1 DUF1643 domain-containing protein [Aliiroseovarius crassostreae]UWQ03348.1 DUF1643 domain-containing protein [Aliiroseovarius crassostreae]